MAVPASNKFSASDVQVAALLELIGSGSITPGSGVAGAVALALAAACARKAVNISLKHTPESTELLSARATLRLVEQIALADGQHDSEAFASFVHEKSNASVDRLVNEGEQFRQLADMLGTAVSSIENKVAPNMAGDIVASRALAAAALVIHEHNEGEALSVRRSR